MLTPVVGDETAAGSRYITEQHELPMSAYWGGNRLPAATDAVDAANWAHARAGTHGIAVRVRLVVCRPSHASPVGGQHCRDLAWTRLDFLRQTHPNSPHKGTDKGMDAGTDGAMDSAEEGQWLTYSELAKIRRIDRHSAVKLVMRHGWRRQKDTRGALRILVPPPYPASCRHGCTLRASRDITTLSVSKLPHLVQRNLRFFSSIIAATTCPQSLVGWR